MKTTVLTQSLKNKNETIGFQPEGVTVFGLIGRLSVTMVACLFLVMKMYVDKTVR